MSLDELFGGNQSRDCLLTVANIAETPAANVPFATIAAGLPVGVHVMGPGVGDLKTIEFAQQVCGPLGGYRVRLRLTRRLE